MSGCTPRPLSAGAQRAVSLAKLGWMANCPGCSSNKQGQRDRLRAQLSREDGLKPRDVKRAADAEAREMRLMHRTVDNVGARRCAHGVPLPQHVVGLTDAPHGWRWQAGLYRAGGRAVSCAIYNEIEAYPVAWLGNLIDAGHIADGLVDSRSIADVHPDDVRHVTQFHTFAGIGVWSYALRLAGWPDDAPVWTGSCPCQPFSAAGKGRGVDDERHLWPVWREIIAECRPPVIFGEQVASPAGRSWFAAVSADLEALGYWVDAADMCAAGVGAPHIRQRLFFGAIRLGDADSIRARWDGRAAPRTQTARSGEWGAHGGECHGAGTSGAVGRLGDSDREGLARRASEPGDDGAMLEAAQRAGREPWADVEWLACRDGKARPTKPGLHPLAHGTPSRVGRLRAAGNAIVPQVAAAFVTAFMGAASDALGAAS